MRTALVLWFTGALLVAGCKEKADTDSADGADGTDGADGADGADGSDGTDGSDGSDGDDTSIPDECWVESEIGECFDCELPTAPGEDSLPFLNQCGEAVYAQFDNATRIPASTWTPGSPLPEVP